MWLKGPENLFLNLDKIETITLAALGDEDQYGIIAFPVDTPIHEIDNGYVLFTGSINQCEITLAEIEAAIVGKVPFLEL